FPFVVEAGWLFVWLQLEMYSRKFGLRLQRKFRNLLKTRADYFRAREVTILDTNLKLARFPAGSPLPVAALPSMSLIPSSPFTKPHELMARHRILKLVRQPSRLPYKVISARLASSLLQRFSRNADRLAAGPTTASV